MRLLAYLGAYPNRPSWLPGLQRVCTGLNNASIVQRQAEIGDSCDHMMGRSSQGGPLLPLAPHLNIEQVARGTVQPVYVRQNIDI